MKNSSQEKLLPYNSSDIFDIVLDIEKYPEFIPWCSASRIISNKNQQIIADLLIRYKYYSESFRSFVNYNKQDLKISIEYTEGPLKSLLTYWYFKPINSYETILQFNLSYEFKFTPFQTLVEGFYNIIENKMILAFEKRASEILKNN